MRYTLLLFAGLLLVFCSTKEVPGINDEQPGFRRGKRLAENRSKKLEEVSGLAASRNNPGLLWAHNDSGNGPDIFLIDQDLSVRQRYVLAGVKNRDWEDIAIGPGPDSTKNYIYIGEIGDNEAVFPLKYIYRFEEPVLDSIRNGPVLISAFETITFKLSDTLKDTEAFLIDPATRNLLVISKREDPVNVYQLDYPFSTGDTLTARQVQTLPLKQVVSASISPDGDDVLIKNYDHIYYWRNSSQMPLLDLLKESPEEIPYIVEPQGESITWAVDNSGFFTISEINKGKKSFLYFYERK